MKKLLLALALVVSPVMAQTPPAGIKPLNVQMRLFCADSFDFLMNVLAAEFKEYPVMMGYLKEEPTNLHTLIYLVNKEMTTSSLVISKRSKDKEQSCILWSGRSPSGMVFSVNPNTMFADEL